MPAARQQQSRGAPAESATLRPASSAPALHAATGRAPPSGSARSSTLAASRTASPARAPVGGPNSSENTRATSHALQAPQRNGSATASTAGSRPSSPAPGAYRYALGPAPVRFPSAKPAGELKEARARSRSAAGAAVSSVPHAASGNHAGTGTHLQPEAGPSSSRIRTQSSPSPSPLFTTTPLPGSASSASLASRSHDPHVSSETAPLLRPPLRFGSRPNSQVFTSFPFPHPTATPPLAATGQRSWLSRLWSRRGSAAPETDAAAEAPEQSVKPAADPEDPYGYRALAGPTLLPAFHAPRLALAREGVSVRAGRRLAFGLAAAVLIAVLLGYALTIGAVILQQAHWPGVGPLGW